MKCPYCKRPAVCIDSKEIYGKSYGMLWICRPCDAYVGCHRGTKDALGTLANFALRRARNAAHAAFDPLWKKGHHDRGGAYALLADYMGIHSTQAHIALFDERQCEKVVEFANLRRAAIAAAAFGSLRNAFPS
jgi:hypothetical protein